MAGQRRGRRPLHGVEDTATTTPSLSHPLSSGRVCLHSIATDVPLSHPLNITPPAAGLVCMVLITGVALDTTPPYKSTPGDDIFKCQKVITRVCFHPFYTVYDSRRTYKREVCCRPKVCFTVFVLYHATDKVRSPLHHILQAKRAVKAGFEPNEIRTSIAG